MEVTKENIIVETEKNKKKRMSKEKIKKVVTWLIKICRDKCVNSRKFYTSEGNEKLKIAKINKYIWCIVIMATMFLILNGVEGFASFINTLYAGLVWGEHSFLEVYKKSIHPCLLIIAPYIVVILGTFICVGNVVVKVWAKWKCEQCGMDGFEKNAFNEKLYDYLTAPSNGKCIVVTAAWGQGKSYQIKKFMKEFMRYRWNHVYTVSCFGIENRDQLKELLENEMYCEDVSLDKIVFTLLEHIPVIGAIVALLREQKYSMKKIAPEDIIVLEDVERMTPPAKAQEDEEKLNILAGFVHELVDRYQNKVILVCNADDFNTQAYQECIYKKLACEEVTISSSHIIEQFMEESFVEKNVSDKKISQMQEILKRKINSTCISESITGILNDAKIENKRLVQKVFSNQADFYKYSKNSDVDIAIDFLYSYLLWEIAKEKANKDENDAEKLLEYLNKMQDTYTFPELYLKIMEDKKGLKIMGNEWWHSLLFFPEMHYWVGILALETYAKKTENIYSEREIDVIKMPQNITVRTQAKWRDILLRNIENKEDKENPIELLMQEIKETEYVTQRDGKKVIKKVKEFSENVQETYINNFLVLCYLIEYYKHKYKHSVTENIRNFIIEEYELRYEKFISFADRHMGMYFSSYRREVIDEMHKKKEELLEKEAKEEVRSDISSDLAEQEKTNNRFEQFVNAASSKQNYENVEEPINQE